MAGCERGAKNSWPGLIGLPETCHILVEKYYSPNLLVGKKSEKLVEIINILATAERTISTLVWFKKEFLQCTVRECHVSTSDDSQGNGIVLIDADVNVIVLCEVCDVASSNAGQNKKEKSDIKNLGCADGVPRDNIRRFISTAPEFSLVLTSDKRKWKSIPYRYLTHQTNIPDKTVLL